MRKTIITVPLWERDITIIVGGDWKNVLSVAHRLKYGDVAIAEIKKDAVHGDDRGAAYFCLEVGEGILWFPNKPVSNATLGHEIVHMVDFISMFIGMEGEMEARAYTADWMFSNLPKVIRKLRH